MAVASFGGHWIQLLRICRELTNVYDICYVTTNANAGTMLQENARIVTVADFNRSNIWKSAIPFFRYINIIRTEKPDVIITTGAAPGLMAILAGKLCGVKCLWIDSIANASELSGSGKLALRIADRVFTQWPHLSNGKVEFHGNIWGTEEGSCI